jgi:hypothetical protein
MASATSNFFFAEMAPVGILRRDRDVFSDIHALLVHSMTTQTPLMAAIDRRPCRLVFVGRSWRSSLAWPVRPGLCGDEA